jgi:hypothetical protein
MSLSSDKKLAGSRDTNVTEELPNVYLYICDKVADIVVFPEPEGPTTKSAFIYYINKLAL